MTLVLASRWTQPENRRREALRAAHTQDADTLTDLLYHHLRVKSRRAGGVSPRTLKIYAVAVRDFLTFVGPPASPRFSVQTLSADEIELYVIHTRERSRTDKVGQGLALGSVATYLYGIRALYRALVWAGAVKENPTLGVAAPRDPTPAHARKRALTPDAYRQMLAAPDVNPAAEVRARDRAALVLGLTLGLRAQEIVDLEDRDVDLRMRELYVRYGKGGKARRLPIPPAAQQVLGEWQRLRGALQIRGNIRADQATFIVSFHRGHYGAPLSTSGLRRMVNGYLRAVGLPSDISGVHTLRRTAGTRLYRATRDLHVVADVLGHTNIATSALYAKLDLQVRLEALSAAENAE